MKEEACRVISIDRKVQIAGDRQSTYAECTHESSTLLRSLALSDLDLLHSQTLPFETSTLFLQMQIR